MEEIQEVLICSKNIYQRIYYDRKIQEFFELKMGNMTMEEYERKFLELSRYVDYIKDEKAKIQRFLSGLPTYYRDKI